MKNKDDNIIEELKRRDGFLTKVKLLCGKEINVWNIAWGYDFGDEFAHITTNCSPFVEGAEIDFFYSNEIKEITYDYN